MTFKPKQYQIYKELITWFRLMVIKYPWIHFRYQWNDKLSVFNVYFSPCDKIEASDAFCIDAMAFEDDMNLKYHSDAPLFSD